MEVGLSDRFPALTPIEIRKERAAEVFLLLARLNEYTAKKNKEIRTKPKKNVVRRPAGDDWF